MLHSINSHYRGEGRTLLVSASGVKRNVFNTGLEIGRQTLSTIHASSENSWNQNSVLRRRRARANIKVKERLCCSQSMLGWQSGAGWTLVLCAVSFPLGLGQGLGHARQKKGVTVAVAAQLP